MIYYDSLKIIRPGVVMIPNWMGPSKQSLEKASRVAGDKYVVFMIDMYGRDIRPKDSTEAEVVAGQLRESRKLMRKRVNAARSAFKDQSNEVSPGFRPLVLFRWGVVLELARSNTEIKALVNFASGL